MIKAIEGKRDQFCWYCGRDVGHDEVVNNDYCCPHCDMDHDKDPQPCVICGNVSNKPGGVHYCNGPRAEVAK